MPRKPAFGVKLGSQQIGQRFEVVSIIACIGFHPRSQGTPGPIGLLGGFVECDVEVMSHKIIEAKLGLSQQTSGEHGVKDRRRHEIVVFAEQAQIVIRAVHDQLMAEESLQKWIEADPAERINQFIAPERADLYEADLFGICVKTVSFRIQRQPGTMPGIRRQFLELRIVIYHLTTKYKSKNRKVPNANFLRVRRTLLQIAKH